MRCPAIPETPVTKAVVAALCTYEVAAIGSGGRLPTITALDKRWRFIGAAIVGALAIHFWAPTPDL
jgi:hypothetical protein